MKRLTPQRALKNLADAAGREFISLCEHVSLQIEIYRPVMTDRQRPHSRDELYIVISESGYFVNRKERHPFQAGEVLFVPAGVEHRFEAFSSNFATWVVFYGPEGGEKTFK